jgi:hypothetical protein
MTPQERSLMTILLDCLNKTEGQLRDPLRHTPAPVMIRTSRARTPRPTQDIISRAIMRVDSDRPPVPVECQERVK